MNLLEINNIGQIDYIIRKVVKLVIINEAGYIHYTTNGLIGGGLEQSEDYTLAAHREALEEVGYIIELVRPLGTVIAYRDEPKLHYITEGYLAKIISKTVRTTDQPDEQDMQIHISNPTNTIEYFKKRIAVLTENPEGLVGDELQGRLFNSMTAAAFLREAIQ
jgi:ADP-ribose pyrophosphatase YjhB (NUDIX family)